MLDLLLHTKSLSDYLQQQDLDFISATDVVTSLLSALQEKRTEACFDEYYSKAQVKCNEIGIVEQELPPPKRRRVSFRIDGVSHTQHYHQKAKDQYRINFFYDTLDIMTNTLKNRFSGATCELLKAFALLHPSRLTSSNASGISKLGDFYKGDLDSVFLCVEYELFRRHSEFHECKSISEVLKLLHHKQLASAYPNVTCLYRICLTLPVTTATTERSFSKLKLLKTTLRSTMNETRLSSLLVLSIERNFTDEVDFNQVIDAFAQCCKTSSFLLMINFVHCFIKTTLHYT